MGDKDVGKSCLKKQLKRIKTLQDWPHGDVAYNFHKFETEFMGQPDKFTDETMAEILKDETMAFILCVACDNFDSLLNIGYWVEQIRSSSPTPNKPIILVLTKADLESGENFGTPTADEDEDATITQADIEKAASVHGLQGAFATSAYAWNRHPGG